MSRDLDSDGYGRELFRRWLDRDARRSAKPRAKLPVRIFRYALELVLDAAVVAGMVGLLALAASAFGCDVPQARPSSEPCDVSHDSPGCNSPDVEGCVCDQQGDHPCCATQWDQTCVDEAQACGCSSENDCRTNACIDGACVDYVPERCCSSASVDCSEGWVCSRGQHTCTLSCAADADCDAVHEWTCDEQRGVCVWPCDVGTECAGGQQCIDGVCTFV